MLTCTLKKWHLCVVGFVGYQIYLFLILLGHFYQNHLVTQLASLNCIRKHRVLIFKATTLYHRRIRSHDLLLQSLRQKIAQNVAQPIFGQYLSITVKKVAKNVCY
jgi:hypothetical protein